MNRWIKRTLVGFFGASVLVAGIGAYAYNEYGHGGWHSSEESSAKMRAKIIERAGSYLDLDAAQKQRLGVLADQLREQRQALMAGTPDPRAEFQALVAGPAFDRARAQALVESKTAALRGKSPDVIAAAADFYDGLQPVQQQKLRDFMNQRRSGRGEHGERD